MAEPIGLFKLADSEPVSLGTYACGVCNQIVGKNRSVAACHCVCLGCGGEARTPAKYGRCESCADALSADLQRKWEAKKVKLLAGAKLVSSKSTLPVSYCDDYYENMDELVEHLECTLVGDDFPPQRVHVCRVTPCLNLERLWSWIAESICATHPMEGLDGIDEFEAAFETFTAANPALVLWEVDYSRAMEVPEMEGRDD